MVRVVVDDGDVAHLPDNLQATADAVERRQRPLDGLDVEAEFARNRQHRGRVERVVPARHPEPGSAFRLSQPAA